MIAVFVALGSNLGDSPALIATAMDRLQDLSMRALLRSSLWRNAPVNCPSNSPPFVNAVVQLTPLPAETPESLLEKLQALEREFGRRVKTVHNEPRPLDLDLIAFGSEIRHDPRLTLPHPRVLQRRFVLQPLSEIAAAFILPGQPKTIAALLAALPPDSSMKKVEASA
jgi:2-amino-4-hydroxy-6-hydroxymethyldihydropteridine diphosphokinase